MKLSTSTLLSLAVVIAQCSSTTATIATTGAIGSDTVNGIEHLNVAENWPTLADSLKYPKNPKHYRMPPINHNKPKTSPLAASQKTLPSKSNSNLLKVVAVGAAAVVTKYIGSAALNLFCQRHFNPHLCKKVDATTTASAYETTNPVSVTSVSVNTDSVSVTTDSVSVTTDSVSVTASSSPTETSTYSTSTPQPSSSVIKSTPIVLAVESKEENSSNTAAIAGGVVGGVVALACAVGAAFKVHSARNANNANALEPDVNFVVGQDSPLFENQETVVEN
eukprot:Pgem_evm1s3642